MRKVGSILLAVMTAFLIPFSVSSAINDTDFATVDKIETRPSENNNYDSYAEYVNGFSIGKDDISAETSDITDLTAGSQMKISVTASESGLYEFYITYRALSSSDLAVSLKIDEAVPFKEAEKLIFPAFWKNSDSKRFDASGNQVAPEQILYGESIKVSARDYTGIEENPYRFYLEKGLHEIVLTVVYGKAKIENFGFTPPEILKSYSEWIAEQNIQKLNGETVTIEGEEAIIKNSKALIPLSDSTSPKITPSNPVKGKLNYVGGSNWKNAGDKIIWEFNVKKAGYYRIGFNVKQSEVLGSASYRHLKIDGKTPYEEAKKIKFEYTSSWNYEEFADKDKPYLIYLDEGRHTLSLIATGGDMVEIYKLLSKITASLSDIYVDITKIVGETVDTQRSYELFKQIPDFNERLKENIDALQNVIKKTEATQERKNGSTISILQNAIEIFEMMLNNPYSAHKYKNGFYDSYTNISAQMGTILDMSLNVDKIFLIGNGTASPKLDVSFTEKALFSIKRFMSTFTSDYASNSNKNSEEITIWVNWGRDQAQALNNVAVTDFEANQGISVNVKVVNATLVQAILAGKGPDCMLQMERTVPLDLAMRGALVNLSEFEDCEQITSQFTETATVPYQYNGGVYALPDTQTFNMMFVRTDILESLGIKIPETWDEFVVALTTLQRNNLQAYVPQTLYPTMLLQNGLSLYNESGTETTFSDTDSINIYKQYSDFFTQYKVPITMNFFNRFRIGSAPIGIEAYTLATQLQAAAPEISGKWTVRPIPGILSENGAVNYVSAGGGTGCGITKISKNKKAAWKFIKWWISKEAQLSFSNELETILGPLGRVAVSNPQAISEMNWEPEMLAQIVKQRNNVREMPEVPGSYYVNRSSTQIFWNIVEMNANVKDTMIKWGTIADSEIKRKILEYSTK